jgi:hypothetical protein
MKWYAKYIVSNDYPNDVFNIAQSGLQLEMFSNPYIKLNNWWKEDVYYYLIVGELKESIKCMIKLNIIWKIIHAASKTAMKQIFICDSYLKLWFPPFALSRKNVISCSTRSTKTFITREGMDRNPNIFGVFTKTHRNPRERHLEMFLRK